MSSTDAAQITIPVDTFSTMLKTQHAQAPPLSPAAQPFMGSVPGFMPYGGNAHAMPTAHHAYLSMPSRHRHQCFVENRNVKFES